MNLGIETEAVEFKKSTSELKEGCASIASILNKHQEGVFYFGVRKDGEVVGQDVSESTMREISTDKLDVLERLDLLVSGRLTNAASVLFCPSKDIELKMGVLESHTRTEILDLQQESGTGRRLWKCAVCA